MITMNKGILVAFCASLFLAACTTVPDSSVKRAARSESETVEAHKALARVWFDEVINRRNLDAMTNAYAVDYVHHGPEGVDIRGLSAARAFAASILAASDDRHAVIEQQVAEGDLVVTRFTSNGHHTGVFRGTEPTGKIWTTEGICISRIEGGKIAEDWEIVHQSGM